MLTCIVQYNVENVQKKDQCGPLHKYKFGQREDDDCNGNGNT